MINRNLNYQLLFDIYKQYKREGVEFHYNIIESFLSLDDLNEKYNKTILQIKDIGIEVIESDKLIDKEEAVYWLNNKEIRFNGNFKYVLLIDNSIDKNIINTLLIIYNSFSQFTYERLYEKILDKYKDYWLTEWNIAIDNLDEFTSNALVSWILYLNIIWYIELIEFNNKSFSIKLIKWFTNYKAIEKEIIKKEDCSITINNWLIRNNSIPICHFTKLELFIIGLIKSYTTKWWIIRSNILTQTKQTEWAFNKSLKIIRKKIRDVWYWDIIYITLNDKSYIIKINK